jgi:hypothetical protein
MLAGEAGNPRRPLVVLTAASIAVLASIFFAAGHMSAFAASHASGEGTATASAQNFEESLRMEITKADGNGMSGKGSATGTIDAKVSLKLHTINGEKAKATFYAHNSHGTLSGTGSAKYSVSGAVSTYNGKINTLEGTGKYSGASSQGITLSGTVNRRTYRMKMALTGRWDA